MSILERRSYYKPFAYPWAYKAYQLQQAMHWLPHEAPLDTDIQDWNEKLTPQEQSLLTQLFRFFTQADVDVACAYFEKYGQWFPQPEIRMALSAIMAAEANHIDSYANLIDTLGLPEVEFRLFMDYEAMRAKHEFMFERGLGKSIADKVVDIAVFSAFGEGMQLFSSFALLMSFQQRSLMKGMTTLIEWSIRDESHHVETMIRIMHELIKEHPRVWNSETKQRIYEACRSMVALEDAFIDQAFSLGPVEGVTPEEAKLYIRYIADRRLLQLGLKPNYNVRDNPFEWLDWIMNAPTHTNFFEQRSTEYGKGEIHGWDKAFDFLKKVAPTSEGCTDAGVCALPESATYTPITHGSPVYRVYTKPNCPYCDTAKALLSDALVPFEAVQLSDADRQEKFGEVRTIWGARDWNTSPMIFKLQDGKETVFIGGARELKLHLKIH